MALKFCANLNFLFTENGTNILERFYLAKNAGFRAVENGFPHNVTVDQAVQVQRETGLKVALLNISLGSYKCFFVLLNNMVNNLLIVTILFFFLYRNNPWR